MSIGNGPLIPRWVRRVPVSCVKLGTDSRREARLSSTEDAQCEAIGTMRPLVIWGQGWVPHTSVTWTGLTVSWTKVWVSGIVNPVFYPSPLMWSSLSTKRWAPSLLLQEPAGCPCHQDNLIMSREVGALWRPPSTLVLFPVPVLPSHSCPSLSLGTLGQLQGRESWSLYTNILCMILDHGHSHGHMKLLMPQIQPVLIQLYYWNRVWNCS